MITQDEKEAISSEFRPKASGHTPGPWEIYEDNYGHELWFGGKGCGMLTVNGWANGGCKYEPDQWAQLLTDARLMGAAPELLSALKLMLDRFSDSGGTYGDYENEAIYAAYAAIAKAEGKV